MKKIEIAIADDHNLFRKGLISLLKKYNEIDVVCEAQNGKALIDGIKQRQPDIVLLNVQMPVMNGFDTLSFIRKKYPFMKVLMLSGKQEESLIFQLMEKGASGFLNKDSEISTLVHAIRSIVDIGHYLSEQTSKAVANGLMSQKMAGLKHEATGLSHRELDVVKLICKQKTIKEIADALCLSPRTVDSHRENIFQKTSARNVVGVVIYAIQNNLMDFQLQINKV